MELYTGTKYVAKEAKITSEQVFNVNCVSNAWKIKNEIELHKQINHKHIIKFKRSFDYNQNTYVLVEDYDKTLETFLKEGQKLSEPECRDYLFQVINAVQYLHKEKKIIHRNLTLSNIIFGRL